jgi:hypothetical protein
MNHGHENITLGSIKYSVNIVTMLCVLKFQPIFIRIECKSFVKKGQNKHDWNSCAKGRLRMNSKRVLWAFLVPLNFCLRFFLGRRFYRVLSNPLFTSWSRSSNNTFSFNVILLPLFWKASMVTVPVYRSRNPGFDSRRYQIFWEVVGLERGPVSLVRITEELLEWKSSGSGSRESRLTDMGICCADHATSSIRTNFAPYFEKKKSAYETTLLCVYICK